MSYHHGNLRKELLDRAARVIADQGIEALSLRALARDLGVSHAAPSRHFKDRTALLAALATEGHNKMREALTKAADAAGDDPIARYNALGRETARFSIQNPAYFQAIEHPDVSRYSDDALQQSMDEYLTFVHEAAAEAQKAGWHPDKDLDVLNLFSVAGAMGTARLMVHSHRRDTHSEEELIALTEQVIDLIIPRTSAGLK